MFLNSFGIQADITWANVFIRAVAWLAGPENWEQMIGEYGLGDGKDDERESPIWCLL